jgi:hypothetical protein
VNFIIFNLNLLGSEKWNSVPSVANGIVSASSILMAVALFSLNYFQGTMINETTKRHYLSSVAMRHVLMLFALLIGEVFLGYLAVSVNFFALALCFFMTCFFLQCGVIFDIWVESRQYCFS